PLHAATDLHARRRPVSLDRCGPRHRSAPADRPRLAATIRLVHLLLLLAVASAIPDNAFVRADGRRFLVDGKPFVFVGANLNVMHGADQRAHAEATIAAARADGLTVGRVWVLGEGDAQSPPW